MQQVQRPAELATMTRHRNQQVVEVQAPTTERDQVVTRAKSAERACDALWNQVNDLLTQVERAQIRAPTNLKHP